MDIDYIELKTDDLNADVFAVFNRYQKVERCWRKEEGQWILKDIAFVEDWNAEDILYLIECLKRTVREKGYVLGAFLNEDLVGFASVENGFFGSRKQYLQLSSIHISCELRGKGAGRVLFAKMCERAKAMGAEKLYISAHSSEETQAFYRKMGCVEAMEINKTLADKEPCDCQLEFDL